MPSVKLSTSNHFILASGTIFTYKDEAIMVEFTENPTMDDKESLLRFEVNFITDPNKDKDVTNNLINDGDEKYLKICIYNVNTFGGTVSPLLIAEDDRTKKKISLSLAFQKVSESFILNYTIFIEK